ncbi:MAG: LysR family transcriptional regulator [Anaerolineales bacterium]|jgi:DNA-binding transcriptional LysR family regulator
MLDVHQINVFLIAAQQMNFSEAARRLHMSQPSVSQHIQALEHHFGMQLFERRGRHLALTEAGQTLLPLARQLVNLSIQIEESIESLHGEIAGHLTIGCCTTAGRYLLPKLLARFREIHPGVQVTCYVTDQHTALEMQNEGKLQLTVVSERAYSKDMEFRKFITDPVILVVPPAHSWAERASIEPQDLPQADFIVREETSGTRRAVAQAFTNVGMNPDDLNVIMTLGTSQAISIAVQEGIGVAFLTRMAADDAVRRGDIVQVQVNGMEISQDVWVGRNVHHPATRAQNAFWEFVNDPENELLINLRRGGEVGQTLCVVADDAEEE